MDREQQLTKLVNVLHRTAKSARNENQEVVNRAREQFNRVLETLGNVDPTVKDVFTPLDDAASGPVVVAACKDLAAYFEDEVEGEDQPFDKDAFKEFWRKSARDIEDVGEFIKESLEQFQHERKRKNTAHTNGNGHDESS